MLSPRNFDRVIFVADGELQANLTLGGENEYSTLFEQHNPDWLGEGRVLVSDSHNNRVVEYERQGGEWEQVWQWRDDRLAWPRDGDRLPNGHTLVGDTTGGRVLEVGGDGAVVWGVELSGVYDVERLGTGDESASAPPGAGSGGGGDGWGPAWVRLAVNALLFGAPPWATVWTLALAPVAVLSMTALATVELIWQLRRYGQAA